MASKERQLSFIYGDEITTDEEKLQIPTGLIEHQDPNTVNWKHHTERVKLLYRIGKYRECSTEISRCSALSDLSDDLSIINMKCSIRIEVHNARQRLMEMILKSESQDQDELIEFLGRLSNNNIDKLLGDERRSKSKASKKQKCNY